MTELVISGATGRLGAEILRHAIQADDLQVVGLIEHAECPLLGEVPQELLFAKGQAEVRLSAGLESLQAGRVLIETAPRAAALQHLARAAEVGAKAIVATTGFDADERAELQALSARMALLVAPNLSPGVIMLQELVRAASKALSDYDLEVLELHHNKKRDAPSGTAWALADAAASARDLDVNLHAIVARAGEIGPRGQDEIGIQSLRLGGVVGDHTVFLAGEHERIELTHRAQSRAAFAAGAIRAARWMGEPREAGAYGMLDVLGLRGEKLV